MLAIWLACLQMSNESQLNVRVPKSIKARLKAEAARSNKSQEIILTAIISDFFKSWSSEERERFYVGKPYARRSE